MLQSILSLSVCAMIHILIPTSDFMQNASTWLHCNQSLHRKIKTFWKIYWIWALWKPAVTPFGATMVRWSTIFEEKLKLAQLATTLTMILALRFWGKIHGQVWQKQYMIPYHFLILYRKSYFRIYNISFFVLYLCIIDPYV